MQEKKSAQNNPDCKDEKHTEHLCFLQYEGYHYGQREQYKALVQNSQFICQSCGRTAQRAENLCAPVAL